MEEMRERRYEVLGADLGCPAACLHLGLCTLGDACRLAPNVLQQTYDSAASSLQQFRAVSS
eukprot:3166196-Alexandrium_andersonii.AAC.1